MKINGMDCESVIITKEGTGEIIAAVSDREYFAKRGLDITVTEEDETDIIVERHHDGKLYLIKKDEFDALS